MKIAIVAPSPVPFLIGGAERVWGGLARAISNETAHDVELIKLPSPERNLVEVMTSYEQFWRLNVDHFDLIITGKYPAWMVRHPNHVVYMLHTLRGLYDTYTAELSTSRVPGEQSILELLALLESPPRFDAVDEVFHRFRAAVAQHGEDHAAFAFPGHLAMRLVRYLDGVALQPSRIRRHVAISRTVATRPGYFPAGTTVAVAYPPSDLEGYRCEGFDYFFSAGRLDHPKRIDLLIRAMTHVRGQTRLLIAGAGPEEARIRAASQADARVELLGRVSSDQLIDLYAHARAVLYVPRDEDLGLVAIEAMSSSKPVITTVDSGGPTELVEHEVTGLVVQPEEAAIAGAMERLAHDLELCRAMGIEGLSRVAPITWANVLAVLLGESMPTVRMNAPPEAAAMGTPAIGDWRGGGRQKLVAVSTFPVYPRMGGGQLRCYGLYGALASQFDVEIISMDIAGSPGREVGFGEGFVERAIAKSSAHVRFDEEESQKAGAVVTDIVASEAGGLSPAYEEALSNALRDADAVILAHPYLLPLLQRLGCTAPIVYDAHNAEHQLKSGMLPATDYAQTLLQRVEEIEREAVRDSVLVTACSNEDAATLAAQYRVDRERIVVIPNGADISHIECVLGHRRAQRRSRWLQLLDTEDLRTRQDVAIFMASWHAPNLEAARRIIDFAPRLPGVLFLLVGSHCEAFRSVPLPTNVRLLGMVPEETKQSLLSMASVGLNPMLTGAGTNLKLVDYFASGLPVVSTPVGSRGIAGEDFVHLRVVPIERFVQGIRHVIANPGEAADQAKAARSLVEARYDWKALGAAMAEAICERLRTDLTAPRMASPRSLLGA